MFAGMMARPASHFAAHQFRFQFFALGNVFHLLGNYAEPRQVHLRHVPVAVGTCLGRFPFFNPAIAQRHVFPLKNGPYRVESVPFRVNRNYVTREVERQPKSRLAGDAAERLEAPQRRE